MLALGAFVLAPFMAERLLHEVVEEVGEDDPVLPPVDRQLHRHEPEAVRLIHPRHDGVAVALLLLAHALGGLMLAQHGLRLRQEGGVAFRHGRAPHTRFGGIQTAFLELLAAPARARLIPSNLHFEDYRRVVPLGHAIDQLLVVERHMRELLVPVFLIVGVVRRFVEHGLHPERLLDRKCRSRLP